MKKTRITDKILSSLIWVFSFLTVAILAWIITYILCKGIGHVSWNFISTIYRPGKGLTGILPMIISTLYLIVLTIAISAPVGIFSAIYLVEYAKEGPVLRIIRFTTETLAGIPSIIYGLFGFIFFVTSLHLRYSLISGALTLSIMVLPTIIRTTEESLKAVPESYKEGSLALGATKLTTIIRVILPCAIPGILSAVILSIGRIVGESAAVIFTAGMSTNIPGSIMDSGRTLTVHLYQLANEGISFQQAYATAAVLIIIVALINISAGKIASLVKRMTIGG